MSGVTITDVKVVALCSKCRKEGDEIPKDINGRIYNDKELSCVGCALGKVKSMTQLNDDYDYEMARDLELFNKEIREWEEEDDRNTK